MAQITARMLVDLLVATLALLTASAHGSLHDVDSHCLLQVPGTHAQPRATLAAMRRKLEELTEDHDRVQTLGKELHDYAQDTIRSSRNIKVLKKVVENLVEATKQHTKFLQGQFDVRSQRVQQLEEQAQRLEEERRRSREELEEQVTRAQYDLAEERRRGQRELKELSQRSHKELEEQQRHLQASLEEQAKSLRSEMGALERRLSSEVEASRGQLKALESQLRAKETKELESQQRIEVLRNKLQSLEAVDRNRKKQDIDAKEAQENQAKLLRKMLEDQSQHWKKAMEEQALQSKKDVQEREEQLSAAHTRDNAQLEKKLAELERDKYQLQRELAQVGDEAAGTRVDTDRTLEAGALRVHRWTNAINKQKEDARSLAERLEQGRRRLLEEIGTLVGNSSSDSSLVPSKNATRSLPAKARWTR